ncbi:MAG: hypothetical protein ABIJ09_17710 [Pseudomonadota bacterium]
MTASSRLGRLLPYLPGPILLILAGTGTWIALTGRCDDGGDPRAQHVSAFMHALEQGSFEAAYQHTTPDLRRRMTRQGFESTVLQHAVLRSFDGGELRFVIQGPRSLSAVSSGHLRTAGGDIPVEVLLERSATGDYLVDDVAVRGARVFAVAVDP